MAAIDVFDAEPLPLNDPLRQAPRHLLTPHLGFVVEPVFEKFAQGVCECLQAYHTGQPLVRQLVAAP
jgi:phosphoglycerate dehydrogenase-like enzyme